MISLILLLPGHGLFELFDQGFQLQGLHEVETGTTLTSLTKIRLRSMSGQKDETQSRGLVFEHTHELKPAYTGHLHVQDRDIEILFLYQFQRPFRSCGPFGANPSKPQPLGQCTYQFLFIIDQKYMHYHAPLRTSNTNGPLPAVG